MWNVLKWGLNFFKKQYNCSSLYMVSMFRVVPLMLSWCSADISEYFVVTSLSRGVLLFRRCSVFRCSVFRRSWFYSMSLKACFYTIEFLQIVLYLQVRFQKQPFPNVFQNRCSSKFRNIHEKTPVLESLFNNAAGLEACNSTKRRLQQSCFPVSIAKFLILPAFP